MSLLKAKRPVTISKEKADYNLAKKSTTFAFVTISFGTGFGVLAATGSLPKAAIGAAAGGGAALLFTGPELISARARYRATQAPSLR